MDERKKMERFPRPRRQLGVFRRSSPKVVCGFFKSGRVCRAGARCPLAHKIPRISDPEDGFASSKKKRDCRLVSKRAFASSEGRSGWDFGPGCSDWGKAKGKVNDDEENDSGGGSGWVSGGGSGWGQQDAAWGNQNKDGAWGPSWSCLVYGSSKLSDARGFGGGVNSGSWDVASRNATISVGGWETNTGDGDDDPVNSSGQADNAWGYKPVAVASSSSGSWGTGGQW